MKEVLQLKEHAPPRLMPLLSGRCSQMLLGQEGLTGASPPSFPHGPQEGGRVQPNFTDHLWEAQGANGQLAVCIYARSTAFLKSGGNNLSFSRGWGKKSSYEL